MIRRRLFTAMSVLSLLLCAATVVLWVRSYWVWDHVTGEFATQPRLDPGRGGLRQYAFIIDRDSMTLIDSIDGCLIFMFTRVSGEDSDGSGLANQGWEWQSSPNHPDRLWPILSSLGKFEFSMPHASYPQGESVSQINAHLPDWCLAAATAVLPVVWVIRFRARNHRAVGRCVKCGYDLRATPHRCPECGTPVTLPVRRPVR